MHENFTEVSNILLYRVLNDTILISCTDCLSYFPFEESGTKVIKKNKFSKVHSLRPKGIAFKNNTRLLF